MAAIQCQRVVYIKASLACWTGWLYYSPPIICISHAPHPSHHSTRPADPRDGREKKAQQQEEVTSDPSSATVAEGGLKLRWTVEESAPDRITGHQAVVDGCTVYFLSRFDRVIHSYDSERKVWSTLPKCPHWKCSLAVVNGLLTTIGGEINYPDCEG